MNTDKATMCPIFQNKIAEEIKNTACSRNITNGATVVLVFEKGPYHNDAKAALPTTFSPTILPFVTSTNYVDDVFENYIGAALEKFAKMLRTGKSNKLESFVRVMGGTQRRRIEDLTVIGENSFKGGFPYKSELFFAIVALASAAPDQNDDIIDTVLLQYGFVKII